MLLAPILGSSRPGRGTIPWGMRAGTAGAVGRLRMRVWASANADGSSARELTSGALIGAIVTLSTTVTNNSTMTWSPGAITLNNEYIFFQLEWQETTQGSATQDSALIYIGAASGITTTNFVNNWQISALFAPEAIVIVKGNHWQAAAADLSTEAVFGGDADQVTGAAGTLWDGAAALVPEAVLVAAESLLQQASASAIIAAAFSANAQISSPIFASAAPTTILSADATLVTGATLWSGSALLVPEALLASAARLLQQASVGANVVAALSAIAQIRLPIFASAAPTAALGSNEQMRMAVAASPAPAAAIIVRESMLLKFNSAFAPAATLGGNLTLPGVVTAWDGSALFVPACSMTARASQIMQIGAPM